MPFITGPAAIATAYNTLRTSQDSAGQRNGEERLPHAPRQLDPPSKLRPGESMEGGSWSLPAVYNEPPSGAEQAMQHPHRALTPPIYDAAELCKSPLRRTAAAQLAQPLQRATDTSQLASSHGRDGRGTASWAASPGARLLPLPPVADRSTDRSDIQTDADAARQSAAMMQLAAVTSPYSTAKRSVPTPTQESVGFRDKFKSLTVDLQVSLSCGLSRHLQQCLMLRCASVSALIFPSLLILDPADRAGRLQRCQQRGDRAAGGDGVVVVPHLSAAVRAAGAPDSRHLGVTHAHVRDCIDAEGRSGQPHFE